MTRVLCAIVLTALLMAAGCETKRRVPVVAPVLVNPAPAGSIVVIGISAETWSLICVERPWGGGYPAHDCLTVGELRVMVLHRMVASR